MKDITISGEYIKSEIDKIIEFSKYGAKEVWL